MAYQGEMPVSVSEAAGFKIGDKATKGNGSKIATVTHIQVWANGTVHIRLNGGCVNLPEKLRKIEEKNEIAEFWNAVAAIEWEPK